VKKRAVFLCLFFCSHIYFLGVAGPELEKGKVLPKVICQDNPGNSYALFLPPAYSAEKRWPILYALDPGGRGHVPVDLFRQAAEKYNFILVGSNNSRNGPWQDVIQSLIALWNDTNERFSIDKKRIYVTGFSGGSRAASIFARVIMHPVAGIIGCGAGLAKSLIKPEQIPPAYYLGIVGIKDFNYREMMLLHDQFEIHNVPYRFLVHRGEHDWPGEDICQRAIEWMEVIAIQNDIRARDGTLIDTVFEKEKQDAQRLESAGEWSQALSIYELLAETFSAWKDTGPVRNKIQIIQKSEEYRNDLTEKNRINRLEMEYLQNFGQSFGRIEKNALPVDSIENFTGNMGLDELKAEAADNKVSGENFMAIRLLKGLEIDAGSKGWEFFQKEEFVKAIFFFTIASQGGDKDSPRKKNIYYNLASAYARIQNKNRALENLELAVKHGFDNVERVEQDKNFTSLQDTEEYQKIIKRLKQ
jgi:tetratricopeptide (TPR) repeat protein